MQRTLTWLGVAAGTAALAWLGLRNWQFLQFYGRLARAKRQADRFYAGCATLTKNIPYSPTTPRTLDVYQPAEGSGHPVIFYVYGGSWNSGNKELYSLAAQRILPENCVFVVPDYTTFPTAGYPKQSEEMAAALGWTLDHIHEYGGDPGRVIVAAQSAGAQIAGLALLDPRFLGAHGHRADEVRGFIGISGVYDMATQLAFEHKLRRQEEYVAKVMGGRANAAAASPLTFAGPHAPPALLIHGDADGTVPMEMSEKLHQRLTEAGVPSELIIYPKGGHSAILFEALAQNPSRLFGEMLAFVRQRTATAPLSQTLPDDPGHPAPAIAA
jgi:acetyl esterase/lipase